jgi:phosphocarrier protein FPr
VATEEASIFDAHLSLLADARDALRCEGPRRHRRRGRLPPGQGCLAEVEREWAELPDPYLSERAADVHAVGDQVLQVLTGGTARQMTSKGVLVARDLTPSETAGLDLGLVTGVLLAEGSPTSHAAILARARDIPVVVAAGPDVLSIPDGSVVLLDGGRGEVYVDPAPEVLAEYRRRAVQIAEQRDRQLAMAERPVASRDGIPFVVAANLGSVADARAALAAGADGAGLVRTEFLFLDRRSAPDIAEQQVSTARSPKPWPAGGSPCAPWTSAGTSPFPTCRCR